MPEQHEFSDWSPDEMRLALAHLAEYTPLGFDHVAVLICARRRAAEDGERERQRSQQRSNPTPQPRGR